jgi:hypothetical protein
MKKTLLVLGICILNLYPLLAQIQADTIQITKSRYIYQGKKLTPKQLVVLTEKSPNAHTAMKKAKSNYDAAYVFSSAGGFLLGWQVGGAIAGREINWAGAGIGGGLFLVSLPFSGAFTKHAKAAVIEYNKGVSQTGLRRVKLFPTLTSDGIGLSARF